MLCHKKDGFGVGAPTAVPILANVLKIFPPAHPSWRVVPTAIPASQDSPMRSQSLALAKIPEQEKSEDVGAEQEEGEAEGNGGEWTPGHA